MSKSRQPSPYLMTVNMKSVIDPPDPRLVKREKQRWQYKQLEENAKARRCAEFMEMSDQEILMNLGSLREAGFVD